MAVRSIRVMVDPEDVPVAKEAHKMAHGRVPTDNRANRVLRRRDQSANGMRGARRADGRENATIDVPVGNTDFALLFDNKPIASSPAIELLTTPEAAKLLAVSVPTVRRLQQQRAIPFIKVGGSVRFEKHDLLSYVERNRVESVG